MSFFLIGSYCLRRTRLKSFRINPSGLFGREGVWSVIRGREHPGNVKAIHLAARQIKEKSD